MTAVHFIWKVPRFNQAPSNQTVLLFKSSYLMFLTLIAFLIPSIELFFGLSLIPFRRYTFQHFIASLESFLPHILHLAVPYELLLLRCHVLWNCKPMIILIFLFLTFYNCKILGDLLLASLWTASTLDFITLVSFQVLILYRRTLFSLVSCTVLGTFSFSCFFTLDDLIQQAVTLFYATTLALILLSSISRSLKITPR